MATRVRVSDGQTEWLASVDGHTVMLDGVEGTFELRALADGRWSIEHGDDRRLGCTATAPGQVWTGVDGAAAAWQVEPASSRARHALVHDDIRSPMAATVVRVHVAAGDTVELGDSLIVVEAMKMEMPLKAPRGATVRAVHCREGDLVQSTDVLVELE